MAENEEKGSNEATNDAKAAAAESLDHLNGPTDSIKGVDVSKMKMILDVPLKVSVELGRTRLLVNDILQLGQGSVIELDKMAGEPMEIYVNDKLIAMGEVVVVNEKFGVRLTDVMNAVTFEEAHPKEAS
jgi:flagellar motor switch protein FliN/FliY